MIGAAGRKAFRLMIRACPRVSTRHSRVGPVFAPTAVAAVHVALLQLLCLLLMPLLYLLCLGAGLDIWSRQLLMFGLLLLLKFLALLTLFRLYRFCCCCWYF